LEIFFSEIAIRGVPVSIFGGEELGDCDAVCYYTNNTIFFLFFGPNCSGAGDKKMRCPEPDI